MVTPKKLAVRRVAQCGTPDLPRSHLKDSGASIRDPSGKFGRGQPGLAAVNHSIDNRRKEWKGR